MTLYFIYLYIYSYLFFTLELPCYLGLKMLLRNMEEVKYYLQLNLKIGPYFVSCINFCAIKRSRKTCLKSLLVCGAYCGKRLASQIFV